MSAPIVVAVAGGTGVVGTTLASKLVAAGHAVLIGSSHPASEKSLDAVTEVKKHIAGGGSVAVRTNADAVAAASVVILTFPCITTTKDVESFASLLGDTKGKVVIDAMNPLGKSMELELPEFTSLGEAFSKALPHAHVFKAFNTIGVAHMADPVFKGKAIDMLFAGPSASQADAAKVIADVGFHPRYVGPIRLARNLESLAELWIHMSYKYGTGHAGAFGFAVVEK